MIALLLLVLTAPRPDQIRNPDQARICATPPTCVDPRPGTLVPVQQIQDGRQKLPSPAWIGEPADIGKPTVCIQTYIGINLGDPAGYVLRATSCYTQLGLALLLADPSWAAWWAVQP
jgi:hypothetical protein